MQPIDLIFNAFSNLTGGLINDLTTAIIGMVGLLILVKGAQKLQSILLDKSIDNGLEDSFGKMNSTQGWERDFHKKRYNRLLDAKVKRSFNDL